jgi:soluble lytic murein transglycosylase-like protein
MIRRHLLWAALAGCLTPILQARADVPTISGAVDKWAVFIHEASHRFGIPASWIRAVMHAESAGHTHLNGAPIRSKAGAMGLMQLMPGTWNDMRQLHNLGNDPDDPRNNILAGTAYLRAMFDRFGYPGLFAAYNAGPARYLASLTGTRLPMETVDYLTKVTQFSPLPVSGQTVFPSLGPVDAPLDAAHDSGLFAIKREAKPAEKPS